MENFDDILMNQKKEQKEHFQVCERIYKRLQLFKADKITYNQILQFARQLISTRLRMIYSRLSRSVGNIFFLHDSNFTVLKVFIGSELLTYFNLYLDPETDMSKVYICSEFNNLSEHKINICQSFDELKTLISDKILQYHTKLRCKELKSKLNSSAPDIRI